MNSFFLLIPIQWGRINWEDEFTSIQGKFQPQARNILGGINDFLKYKNAKPWICPQKIQLPI